MVGALVEDLFCRMPRDVSLKFLPGLRSRVRVDARKQSQQGISCDLLERTRNLNEMLNVEMV